MLFLIFLQKVVFYMGIQKNFGISFFGLNIHIYLGNGDAIVGLEK